MEIVIRINDNEKQDVVTGSILFQALGQLLAKRCDLLAVQATKNQPSVEPQITAEPADEPQTATELVSEPQATDEPADEPEATTEPADEPETSGPPKITPDEMMGMEFEELVVYLDLKGSISATELRAAARVWMQSCDKTKKDVIGHIKALGFAKLNDVKADKRADLIQLFKEDI